MRRAAPFLFLTAVLAGAFFYRPAGPSLCMSKTLLKASCPGCGMVRSLTSLAQGRFRESLHYHLFGPLVFAVLATVWGLQLYCLVRRKPFHEPRGPAFNGGIVVGMALLIGYWIARLATGTVP